MPPKPNLPRDSQSVAGDPSNAGNSDTTRNHGLFINLDRLPEAWFPKPLLSVPTSAQGDDSPDDTGVAALIAESLCERTLRWYDMHQ